MKKSFLIIIACVISIILFQAFTTSKEPHFKNLQILPKDISDHDLDTVMHHFSAALGVKCNFCHVRNEDAKKMDFASDDKPEKNIARKMMLMSIDINKNYFKGMDKDDHDMDHDNMKHDTDKDNDKNHDLDMSKNSDHSISMGLNGDSKYMLQSVTCFTCHRGDPHPESKTPPHEEGPRPPAQPQPKESK